MSSTTTVQMVNLIIDDQPVSVPKGTTVYHAAKQLKIDLPIFCYQDRMPPFGACRMCLVEVEKMPKLQTSCTLEVSEGMVVRTQSHPAVKGRKDIIEFLLINHPLDCPICDKGGECPLQDNAMACGPGESRFHEEKRHFKKPISLGPVLTLDRERCIICARCTRFSDIVAGDHALEFIDRGFKTEVGTPNGGPAESKFIGNTIMICPVGALTSTVYRFRARPWDNDTTNTTCTLCPVGCSMKLDARDGEIMRTRSNENPDVNDIWLCDKGWFGYEFSSHSDRLQTPLIRRNGNLEAASWSEALDVIATKFLEAKASGKIAALGGNTLTFEESYLLQKLIREGAGVNNVDHRVGMPLLSLEEEGLPPGMEISIGETEKLSYAILAGIDLTEEFPIIWLRLKQAINHGAKVIFIGNYAPEMSHHLTKAILHPPGREIETLEAHRDEILGLSKLGKGALFVGRQYLASTQRRNILSKLLELKSSVDNLSLNLLEGKGNSLGARLAGMHPELKPFEERLNKPGLNTLQILEAASKESWGFLYAVGADIASKAPSALWQKVRNNLNFLVVQDIFLNETARQADVVLPSLSYVEKRGSFINIEGRIQQLHPGKDIEENLFDDGTIFQLLAKKLNIPLDINADHQKKLKESHFSLSRAKSLPLSSEKTAESALRASFAPALFDYGVRMKHNPHVLKLAKEPKVRLHPNDATKHSISNHEKITLKNGHGTITAKVSLDKAIAEGTVVLPLGFEQIPVHEFGVNLLNGMPMDIG